MTRRGASVHELIQDAVSDGVPKRAFLGAAVAAGAVSAAKLGWDRLSSRDDPRRFRLREGEPVSTGLQRVALGQLDGAIERLERGSEGAVHDARKSFKRVRAIVRLARDELGEDIYKRDNRELRDLGRRLSGARDSEVLLETLDSVGEAHPAPPGLRESLVGERALAARQLDGDGVVRELHELRDRIAAWPLEPHGIEGLEPGFRRIYRRARRACRRAQRDPTVENLHELRKRTKDVWFCAALLRPAAPKRMKRLAKEAHELSDLIGQEHDLAILAERVQAEPLTGLVESRREELVRELLPLARRLYRKKPRKVARSLERAAARLRT
jgi:CHAD domain-containing protein